MAMMSSMGFQSVLMVMMFCSVRLARSLFSEALSSMSAFRLVNIELKKVMDSSLSPTFFSSSMLAFTMLRVDLRL